MTDEAPTAAEVQALIARLNDNIGIGKDGGLMLNDGHVRDMREAAAALAAQAQRIAELERDVRVLTDSYDVATNRQAVPRECAECGANLVCAYDMKHDAAPAAAPGEKP